MGIIKFVLIDKRAVNKRKLLQFLIMNFVFLYIKISHKFTLVLDKTKKTMKKLIKYVFDPGKYLSPFVYTRLHACHRLIVFVCLVTNMNTTIFWLTQRDNDTTNSVLRPLNLEDFVQAKSKVCKYIYFCYVPIWNKNCGTYSFLVFQTRNDRHVKMRRLVHLLRMTQQAWMSWGSGTKCTAKVEVERNHHLDLGADFEGSVLLLTFQQWCFFNNDAYIKAIYLQRSSIDRFLLYTIKWPLHFSAMYSLIHMVQGEFSLCFCLEILSSISNTILYL